MKLKILDKRLGDCFPLPGYATDGSAGMDLRCMTEQVITLGPGESRKVPSGIAIYIQTPNICGKIIPRSGMGFNKGLVLGNLTGLIDSDYQGPLEIPLWNRSDTSITLKPGDRVAQIVFMPVHRLGGYEVVEEFSSKTDRGEGGFGSSGDGQKDLKVHDEHKITSIDDLVRGDYIVHFFDGPNKRVKGQSRKATSLMDGRALGYTVGQSICASHFSVDRRIELFPISKGGPLNPYPCWTTSLSCVSLGLLRNLT